MILKNGGRLVKEYLGIDFSGKVIQSDNSKFKEGDEVILTGYRVGETFLEAILNCKSQRRFLVKNLKIYQLNKL